MKKAILSLTVLSLTLISLNTKATVYTCTRTNTGKYGCKYVTTSHSEDGKYEYVECEDPGEKVCQFGDGHCPKNIGPSECNDIVLGQIDNGVMSGRIELPNGSLTWDAQDDGNLTYSVIDNTVE